MSVLPPGIGDVEVVERCLLAVIPHILFTLREGFKNNNFNLRSLKILDEKFQDFLPHALSRKIQ